MTPFPDFAEIRPLIDIARREDLGPALDDCTSRLCIGEDVVGVGTLYQKAVGIACGLPLVEHVCRIYDERIRVELIPGFHMDVIEGRFSDQRQTPLLRLRGPLRSLLAAERVVLNFIQRCGGVATATQAYVRRVEGTRAKVYDTRKTLPGFRALDKYAVRVGGGENHRVGLFDMMLVKDNHLAGIPVRGLADRLSAIVAASRSEAPRRAVEVEVDSLEQLREVLKVEGIDVVLLDNMDCPTMTRAVAMRDESPRRGALQLEASGGVTLETIRSIAQTGVDRVSVGAITHSVKALDISLDIERQ
jgi:nicotinate-nucleotide pyrophosphorylase (carboxylating)